MSDAILYPPNGFDRADGTQVVDGFQIGTPSPAGSRIFKGSNGETLQTDYIFEEDPSSPEIERAEQATIRHVFECDVVTGQQLIQAIGRGYIFTDSQGNTTKVLSHTYQYMKSGRVRLTMVCEGLNFDSPPDQFRLEVVELNPAIEKHIRYSFLTYQERMTVNNAVNAATFNIAQDRQTYLGDIKNHPVATGWPGTPQQHQDAAQELYSKRRIGEDTFYLPGFVVTWAQFFYLPPYLNPGGYIEDPIDGGLPYYFWSPTQDPTNSESIFSLLPAFNPQFYQSGISWLRLSDNIEYERTWFKITRSWHGAAYSNWDADIYSQLASPYPAPPNPFPRS